MIESADYSAHSSTLRRACAYSICIGVCVEANDDDV